MPGILASIQLRSIPGLIAFVLLWLLLVEGSHLLLALVRRDQLIGWAIGPLGITTLFVREPSRFYIVLEALLPAVVSGSMVYIGFFTAFGPVALPHHLLWVVGVTLVGVLITSTGDIVNALCDLLYPLWGEARVLRHIQILRASWATIHFTPFGRSYLRDRFQATPTELLKAF
ncbi:hypothetical protein [Thermogemmatispora onikobensis]|uniref:hypothetical protein n=1 Tax=Thermogemmatispora onikobensis TaxID=732234 RepID=UPI000853AA4B|nr:hypothetical protein [Thermogemmatispora onikobensis]